MEMTYPFRAGGMNRVRDAQNIRVADCPDARTAVWLADTLNAHFRNKKRSGDPDTSGEAADKSDVTKTKHFNLARELYEKHGPMSDEKLHTEFMNSEVNISQSTVRHIRKNLVEGGWVEWKKMMTAQTVRGCKCRVFGLKLPLTNTTQ